MTEIILAIIAILGTGITSFISYRGGKRLAISQAGKSEIQNVEEAIKIWRELAESMAQKVSDNQLKYEAVYKQNLELIAQNKLLISKITHLEKTIENSTKEK
jgi:cell shape-determining protein MreC